MAGRPGTPPAADRDAAAGHHTGPWTPVDTLAVGRLLAWRLAENHQSELVRAAVAQKLGRRGRPAARRTIPADAPTVLGLHRCPGAGPGGRRGAVDGWRPSRRRRRGPPAGAGRWSGLAATRRPWPAGLEWLHRWRSGATATTGWWPARTSGGRPILANDPHLLVEFPSVWYEMHLVAAGLDVIGVTIPGVPFVVSATTAHRLGLHELRRRRPGLALERLDVGTEALHVSRRVAGREGDARGHSGSRPRRRAVRRLANAPRHRFSASPAWTGRRRPPGCHPVSGEPPSAQDRPTPCSGPAWTATSHRASKRLNRAERLGRHSLPPSIPSTRRRRTSSTPTSTATSATR